MTVISRFRWWSAAGALIAGLALVASTGTPMAQDSSGDTVVARLNGDPITENDLAAAARVFNDQVQQMQGDPRKNLIDIIVNMRLGAKAAAEAGLEKDPVNAAQLTLARDQTLYIAYMRAQVADALTVEAAAQAFRRGTGQVRPRR